MQFIQLFTLFSLIAAGPGDKLSATALSHLKDFQKAFKSAKPEAAHNAIVLKQNGKAVTFRDINIPQGQVKIIKGSNHVQIDAGKVGMLSHKRVHPELQPLFAPKGAAAGIATPADEAAIAAAKAAEEEAALAAGKKGGAMKKALIGGGLLGAGALAGGLGTAAVIHHNQDEIVQ